jgi:diguanylate cyclase (GGDEF)-like protein
MEKMPFYTWPSNLNIILTLLEILTILGVTIYLWNRRNIPGARFFIAISIIILIWSISYGMVLFCYSLKWKEFWENLEFSVLTVIPVLYLFFFREYTYQKKNDLIIWIIFLLQPVISSIVIWSGLFPDAFRTSSVIITNGISFPGYLISTFGNWFWFSLIYQFVFLAIDLGFILLAFRTAPKWTRYRFTYLIVGLFTPWIVLLLTISHWEAIYTDSIFIFSVTASSILLIFGITLTRIFNILPVARDTLLDQIGDLVFILDEHGRIVDINKVAKKKLADAGKIWPSQSFTSVIPEISYLSFDDKFTDAIENEIAVAIGESQHIFEVRISPLMTAPKMVSGWVAIFHDITHRKAEEKRLVEAEGKIESSLIEMQNQRDELRFMQQISETLNQATSVRASLIPVFTLLKDVIHFDQLWVCLIDSTDPSIHREVYYDPNSSNSPLNFIDGISNDLPCLKSLDLSLSQGPHIWKTQENRKFGRQIRKSSFISFPLYSRQKAIGLLNVSGDTEQFLSEKAIQQIKILCSSLSATLDRVLLLKTTYTERRLSDTFRQINSKLTSSLDLNNVLDLLLDQISRLVPMDAGSVMEIEEDSAHVLRMKGFDVLGKDVEKMISQYVFSVATTENIRKVVSSKSPTIVSDIQKQLDWKVIYENEPFRSWLGCPVLINDEVSLIFSLSKYEPNTYTEVHAKLLNDFCTEVALAIQNAQLFESEKKRLRELESMQITLNDISSELDVQKLLGDIMHRAFSLLGTRTGLLALYQENQQVFKVVVGSHNGKDLTNIAFSKDEGLVHKLWEQKQPTIIEDYPNWENRIEKYTKIFSRSLLAVPLLGGDQVVGILLVGSDSAGRKFHEDDIRLLTLFGQQAIIALKNAQLIADSQQKAEEAETLRLAGAIVASTLKQKPAMDLILDQLQKVVPYDSASILLLKENELTLVEGHGFTGDSDVQGMKISLNENQPGPLVFKQRKPIVINNMLEAYPSFAEYNHLPISSWIGVPLVVKNRVIGILSLDSLEANRYNDNHARLVSAFADQVAVALENIRLYEDALKSAKQFSSLYTLSQSISANLQPQNVFNAIYRAASELMPCDIFMISLYDEKTQMINDVYSIEKGVLEKPTTRPFGDGLFSKAIRENRSLLYNHFTHKDVKRTKAVLIGEEDDETLVQSILIVPLRSGKEIKGVLSTQSYEANKFTEENKETLEMLATHSAIALENARLFNEIQELAMTDSLTKIYNRRKFYEFADGEFERARRYNHPLSVIMMDIDKFKLVNDSYGHSAGDQVLTRIAELCNSSMRSIDILARYGGEEFVAMLPETTISEAQLTAERLRQLIARTPIKVGNSTIKVTLSFGVVELEEDCKTIEELMARSDQAMYASKNSGRNRVTLWSPRLAIQNEVSEDHFHL